MMAVVVAVVVAAAMPAMLGGVMLDACFRVHRRSRQERSAHEQGGHFSETRLHISTAIAS
jgi:hypothetical protein